MHRQNRLSNFFQTETTFRFGFWGT